MPSNRFLYLTGPSVNKITDNFVQSIAETSWKPLISGTFDSNGVVKLQPNLGTWRKLDRVILVIRNHGDASRGIEKMRADLIKTEPFLNTVIPSAMKAVGQNDLVPKLVVMAVCHSGNPINYPDDTTQVNNANAWYCKYVDDGMKILSPIEKFIDSIQNVRSGEINANTKFVEITGNDKDGKIPPWAKTLESKYWKKIG